MKRNANGLEPHEESKISLTMTDKIIFAVGASGYGITLILEEKFNKGNEISSSIAIAAVGTFLIFKAFENKKLKEFLFLKDKLLFWIMIIVGIGLDLGSVISLIRYLMK